MSIPGNRDKSRKGWGWSDDDTEIIMFERGDVKYMIIVGSLEHYGRGVFKLKKDGTRWELDEILGRPRRVAGVELDDEH